MGLLAFIAMVGFLMSLVVAIPFIIDWLDQLNYQRWAKKNLPSKR